jgi:GTP-binding protein
MKVLNADFVLGAASEEQFPEYSYPEFAFAGRSNVGKSSLLNSIVMNKKLAKTSSTPGKTQQINFFIVEKKWSFADLPGFGYAAIGKQHRVKWAKLNHIYLEKRKNLRNVFVLIDSRHDPMEQDLALIEWLENNEKPYTIILTKCDKINSKHIEERKQQLETFVSQCNFAREVLPYSSQSGMGRFELLAIIKDIT